jgi:pyruvate,water dikinase
LRLRETIKSRVIHWFALVRRMLLKLGTRLVRRGLLVRDEDIFFLDWKELSRAAAGRVDFRPIIARRRDEHERNAAMDPPPVIFGEYDPAARGAEVVDTGVREFRGISVSPGIATGQARRILRVGEGQVEPGEVLVAPTTDPGWAPYFLNASAIVMDQGGVLSHGSIIAREYGIPCVVNVGPASRIIQTGQVLEVDGGRGVVRIVA